MYYLYSKFNDSNLKSLRNAVTTLKTHKRARFTFFKRQFEVDSEDTIVSALKSLGKGYEEKPRAIYNGMVHYFTRVLRGKYTNFFVETPELTNWLRDVRFQSFGDLIGVIDRLFETRNDLWISNRGNDVITLQELNGMIHLPNETDSYAFAFYRFLEDGKKTIYKLLLRTSESLGYGLINFDETQDIEKIEAFHGTQLRVILNYFIYAVCFPDHLVSGIPSGNVIYPDGSRAFVAKTKNVLLEKK